jgi:DNA-binding PadR family transcriptional regulator
VSPVFRHGRLRLYLLKLLDEAPRHGYEVIRLLQDRFMGVYAPSPGTIYPRLARLEEDGLVTHEEVDGKKVYSITDKGREEIRARLGDLADLEDELTESLRDVAREISVDVRETVRSIREELASAAREFRTAEGRADRAGVAQHSARPEPDEPHEPNEQGEPGAGGQDGSEDARRIREEARRSREQMRASFRARNRGRGDWGAWSSVWSDWATGGDDNAASGWGHGAAFGPGQAQPPGGQRSRRGGPSPFSDLERMAIQFATELRAAATQTGNIGERSLNDLRDILTDTLAKVRDEVFAESSRRGTAPADEPETAESGRGGDSGTDKTGKD